MLLGPSDIGVASVAAATTLTAVKTIEFLVRKRNGNGNNSYCKAQACEARDVIDRLQEYHEENREVLRDIRDGINLIALLLDRRKINRD